MEHNVGFVHNLRFWCAECLCAHVGADMETVKGHQLTEACTHAQCMAPYALSITPEVAAMQNICCQCDKPLIAGEVWSETMTKRETVIDYMKYVNKRMPWTAIVIGASLIGMYLTGYFMGGW